MLPRKYKIEILAALIIPLCNTSIYADSNNKNPGTIEILQEEGFIDKDNKTANWLRENSGAPQKSVGDYVDEAKQNLSKKIEQGYNKVFAPELDPERMQAEQNRQDAANREAQRQAEIRRLEQEAANERMTNSVNSDRSRCDALATKTSPQAEANKAECLQAVENKWREMGTCKFGNRNAGVSVEQCQQAVIRKYDVQIGRLEVNKVRSDCEQLDATAKYSCLKKIKDDKERGLDMQENVVNLNKNQEPPPKETKDQFQQLLDEGAQKREQELRKRNSEQDQTSTNNDRRTRLNERLNAIQQKIDRGDVGANRSAKEAYERQASQNERALNRISTTNSNNPIPSTYNNSTAAAIQALGTSAAGVIAAQQENQNNIESQQQSNGPPSEPCPCNNHERGSPAYAICASELGTRYYHGKRYDLCN